MLFPFLCLTIIGKIIGTPEFNAKYGALIEGVEYAENMTKVFYTPLFVMQRLVFGGAMVYLNTIPIVSVITIAVLHGLMIFSILYYKPFPAFVQRASIAMDELSQIVFLVYALVLAKKNNALRKGRRKPTRKLCELKVQLHRHSNNFSMHIQEYDKAHRLLVARD